MQYPPSFRLDGVERLAVVGGTDRDVMSPSPLVARNSAYRLLSSSGLTSSHCTLPTMVTAIRDAESVGCPFLSVLVIVFGGRGTMEVAAVGTPAAPGPGEVLVAPEAVGIGTIDDPSTLYPRIQGHEASATILELGTDCPPHLATSMRVALWPVSSCGECYPCWLGRGMS